MWQEYLEDCEEAVKFAEAFGMTKYVEVFFVVNGVYTSWLVNLHPPNVPPPQK